MNVNTVWVFSGEKSTFPGGVFLTREGAEEWIATQQLSGALTQYPVDAGAYDHALQTGAFVPAKDSEKTPEFIQRYSDARMEHAFYKLGVIESKIELTSYPIGDFFVEICHLGRSPSTGCWQVSVEIAGRDGTVLTGSGRIDSDAITVSLLTKMLPQKFPAEDLAAIVESSWKDKFVL